MKSLKRWETVLISFLKSFLSTLVTQKELARLFLRWESIMWYQLIPRIQLKMRRLKFLVKTFIVTFLVAKRLRMLLMKLRKESNLNIIFLDVVAVIQPKKNTKLIAGGCKWLRKVPKVIWSMIRKEFKSTSCSMFLLSFAYVISNIGTGIKGVVSGRNRRFSTSTMISESKMGRLKDSPFRLMNFQNTCSRISL